MKIQHQSVNAQLSIDQGHGGKLHDLRKQNSSAVCSYTFVQTAGSVQPKPAHLKARHQLNPFQLLHLPEEVNSKRVKPQSQSSPTAVCRRVCRGAQSRYTVTLLGTTTVKWWPCPQDVAAESGPYQYPDELIYLHLKQHPTNCSANCS